MTEETKRLKAKNLRFKKPICRDLNLDAVKSNLYDIMCECEDIRWYTGWNLWLIVSEVSEKYYSYPLPDNSMIVVKETEHTKGDSWWKEDDRGGYYVTTEYYLLEGDWERFADCKKSKTQIIEHLREIMR